MQRVSYAARSVRSAADLQALSANRSVAGRHRRSPPLSGGSFLTKNLTLCQAAGAHAFVACWRRLTTASSGGREARSEH